MNKILIGSMAILSIGQSTKIKAETTLKKNPNIVLIMCDDMGFSDIGCYGGEIHTPNIDALANNGIRFSQMKNTGRSCPSRASLMTGYYQHQAGMGWMTAVDENRDGYRGQLSDEIPTMAEVFKSNGYTTYMTGKWHLTKDAAFETPNNSYPTQRGFDKYYGCLSGGGSYWKPNPLYVNLTKINKFADDYYYTHAITEHAVKYIDEHDNKNPMLLYIAHYAPHLPLEAPKDRIEKCIEKYKIGFDSLRRARFERQKKLGLVEKNSQLPIYQKEFDNKRPTWNELSLQQQEKWVIDMATYAAMIEIMDDGIGEVIEN